MCSSDLGVVAIFCQRLLAGRSLRVFGDGEQTRDYVYVGDVARANLLAARCGIPAAGRLDDRAFNIGTGVGTSVRELIETLREVTGFCGEIRWDPSKPDGALRKVLDRLAETRVARDEALSEMSSAEKALNRNAARASIWRPRKGFPSITT